MAYGLGSTSTYEQRPQAPSSPAAGGGSLQQRRQSKLTSAGFDMGQLQQERESARAEMLRADRFLRAQRMRQNQDRNNPDLQLPLGDAEAAFDQARKRFMDADKMLRADATDMTPDEVQAGRDRLQEQYKQIRASEPGQIVARARQVEDEANAAIRGYAKQVEPSTEAYYGTAGEPAGSSIRARVVDEIPWMTPERLREATGGYGAYTVDGMTYPEARRLKARQIMGEEAQAISPPGRPDEINFGDMPGGQSPVDDYALRSRVGERLNDTLVAKSRGRQLEGAGFQAALDAASQPERAFQQDADVNKAKILGLQSETDLNAAKARAIGLGEGMLPEEIAARGAQAGLSAATAKKQMEQIGRGGLTQDAAISLAENVASNFTPLAYGSSVDPAKSFAQLSSAMSILSSIPPEERKPIARQIIQSIEFQFPNGFLGSTVDLPSDDAGRLRQFYSTMRQWAGGASTIPVTTRGEVYGMSRGFIPSKRAEEAKLISGPGGIPGYLFK